MVCGVRVVVVSRCFWDRRWDWTGALCEHVAQDWLGDANDDGRPDRSILLTDLTTRLPFRSNTYTAWAWLCCFVC